MQNRMIRRLVISALCTAALLVCAVACPRQALRPTGKICMKEYIELLVPHAGTDSPVFPVVLEVPPVEMDMKLKTDYHPDRAFKGKFTKELHEGAIAYLNRVGMFIAVREDGGELSLKMRVLSYEASRRANPQKISLVLEVALVNVKQHQTLIYGKFGSQVVMPFKEFYKPMEITPPGGGRAWVVEQGAFELAQICLKIYQNIEKQITINRAKILGTLN